ncbi:MAG: DUF1311 domain-containing protein [Gemmatimonadales bacterium]|nr:DUF1311 domain-containing protein [Gemmatimonadales bacterium]
MAGLLPPAARRAVILVGVPAARISCRGDEGGGARGSGDPEAPGATASAADGTGMVGQNQPDDSWIQPSTRFNFDYCGMCPRDPVEDWGSDFSRGFLGEGESCTYAPSRLVDRDPQTGWAEGGAGAGIGAEVAVPALLDTVRYYSSDDEGGGRWAQADPLDLSRPVRIWGGYGRSPELFAANARPKRVRVSVLRLRLTPDPNPHDATGCSFSTYVEPVVVAEHEVALEDLNGYQDLPVPGFDVEHYDEYPMEWLRMDGTERHLHQQRVDAGEAAPYQPEPREYAYALKLTLLEVYAGTRHEDTVISEIGNDPRFEAAGTVSADAAELWAGTWYEPSSTSLSDNVYSMMEIYGVHEHGFDYGTERRDVPYGPNATWSGEQTAWFEDPRRAVDLEAGRTFLLTVDPADPYVRVIDVVEGAWSSTWTFGSPFFRAGFDCDAATTPVETAICGDETLARGDFEMSELYGELIGSVGADREPPLRADQRDFLTRRDSDCQSDDGVDKRCVARLYADRLVVLQRLKDPALGDGSRFDTRYAMSILDDGGDLRQNTAARLAMYPLQMEEGTAAWGLDASGLLYEQSYTDTRVVWPADIEIRYSDMFYVGTGGEVWTAAHMAPADSISYSEINAEYGFEPWRIELDAGRDFLTIWMDTGEPAPDMVRDWLERHPIPDLEAWD